MKMKAVLVGCWLAALTVASFQISPDCKDQTQLPVCISEGLIINPSSANPLPSRQSSVSGWSFVSGPLTNNVAWSLYSSATTSQLFPTEQCRALSYGNFISSNILAQSTVWFVVDLIKSSSGNSTAGAQPIIGIFSNGTSPSVCPLIYNLPTAVQGSWYVFTNYDEGSYRDVGSRIMMTNKAFPCSASAATLVSFILFGTMQIPEETAEFVLRAAGFTTPLPGCNADYTYII